MKRSLSTAFYHPNNNTEIPGGDAKKDPAPKRVAPTMLVRDSTPDPIAAAGISPATPIQALGPISQPLLLSMGQASEPQQAPGSTSIQDADVNLADKNGQTRLMLAAQDGDLPVVQILLSNGAATNAIDHKGQTPLMYAATQGHLTTVQALLNAPRIDIHAKALNGATALIVATDNGKDDVVQALIDHGADVYITEYEDRTPLIWAAEKCHLPIVETLLSAPRSTSMQKEATKKRPCTWQ